MTMDSYRNPAATWRGSPNFTPDRAGHDMTQPSWVVLHTMVGTEAAANGRFQQPAQQASATYGVKLDGSVVQWVDEKDAAWANGATGRGGRGDNLDSISIEHEDDGDYNGPRTPELYAASAALLRGICTRYAIPIDRDHVIGHRECDYAQTACPDALDVDRIVVVAAGLNTPGGHDMATLDEILAQVDGSGTGFAATVLAGNSGWQEAVDTKLDDLKAAVGRIEAALKTA